MPIRCITRLCLALSAFILTGSPVLASDIHVLTGGAPKEVLLELVPDFEKKTGHKVHIAYAVVNGDAEIGFYPLSEIISVKGVVLAGMMPNEVQLDTVYAAGVLSASAAPEAAIAFVNFLADPAHAKNWKDAGFEPAN